MRALLADDQGLGKTLSTIAAIETNGKYPVLIVCPASVKGNWASEWKKWVGKDAYIVEGQHSDDIPDGTNVAICNYDIAKANYSVLCNYLYDCIVFDESHMLSDRTTGRTKVCMLLARRARHVICLSGTPISNRPADFWPTLNMLRPKDFPTFAAYAWRYCAPSKKPWGWEYKGASNLGELHEKIKPFTLRRRKDQIAELNLPSRTTHVIPIELETPDEYKEAESSFIDWLTKRKHHKVEKAMRAEALVKMNETLMLSAKLKSKAVVKWCQEYMKQHPDKKMIIFATHTQMLQVLVRRVYPEGVVYIDGSVASSKRHAIVQKFQTDPSIRLLVGNLKAAGTGITLTAATVTVMAELPWTAAAVGQGSDRNYRIGQTKDVDLVFLVARGTIEEKLCKILQEKQSIQEQVIEGKAMNDLPVLDMFIKAIHNDAKQQEKGKVHRIDSALSSTRIGTRTGTES